MERKQKSAKDAKEKRLTKQIDNYTDGNPATGGSDEDVTVQMAYNWDGKLTTLTAKNPTTGDQVTKYVYGTSTGDITPEIYRKDLLRAEFTSPTVPAAVRQTP